MLIPNNKLIWISAKCKNLIISNIIQKSQSLNKFIFTHSHNICLHVNPDHHHLTADPRLLFTVLLQIPADVEIFWRVKSVQLLVHLEIAQPILLPQLLQLLWLLWEHRLDNLCFFKLLRRNLCKSPAGHVTFFIQTQLFLDQGHLWSLIVPL